MGTLRYVSQAWGQSDATSMETSARTRSPQALCRGRPAYSPCDPAGMGGCGKRRGSKLAAASAKSYVASRRELDRTREGLLDECTRLLVVLEERKGFGRH